MLRFLPLLVVVGCGTVKFDEPEAVDAAIDAPPDDIDTPPVPRPCSPTTQFGPLKLVPTVNDPSRSDDVSLTDDELEAYFVSTPNGGQEVFRARRTAANLDWDPPQNILPNGAPVNGFQARISPDGLSLFVPRNVGPSRAITVLTRASRAVEFGPPMTVAGIDSTNDDQWPSINAAGTVLYFTSLKSGKNELYRSERSSPTALFGTPELVGNTADYFSPVVTDDGLGVFFAKFVPGTTKPLTFYASRASIGDPFSDGVHLAELTQEFGGWPGWVSSDLCRLYLIIGDKPGGPGDLDIWFAERSPI